MDSFYHTVHSFEKTVENASDKENRKRDLRNEWRRVEREYKCIHIGNGGPHMDRYIKDEADVKVKSSLCLSLGRRQTEYIIKVTQLRP